jgi:hypothetical protein
MSAPKHLLIIRRYYFADDDPGRASKSFRNPINPAIFGFFPLAEKGKSAYRIVIVMGHCSDAGRTVSRILDAQLAADDQQF